MIVLLHRFAVLIVIIIMSEVSLCQGPVEVAVESICSSVSSFRVSIHTASHVDTRLGLGLVGLVILSMVRVRVRVS